jgi:hypothetical protein
MAYAKGYEAVKAIDAVTFDGVTTETVSEWVDTTKFKRLTLYIDGTVTGAGAGRTLTVKVQYSHDGETAYDYMGDVGSDFTTLVLDSLGKFCYTANCAGAWTRITAIAAGTEEGKTITLNVWLRLWS